MHKRNAGKGKGHVRKHASYGVLFNKGKVFQLDMATLTDKLEKCKFKVQYGMLLLFLKNKHSASSSTLTTDAGCAD